MTARIVSDAQTCEEARMELYAWLVSRAISERGLLDRSKTRLEAASHAAATSAFYEAANFFALFSYPNQRILDPSDASASDNLNPTGHATP
jgi:hypothetical protein